MKIGIYGGTFNPPHLGHMAAGQAAMAVLGLDKLFFIPAALPPHKELPTGGAGAEHRLAMTALMADALGESIGRRGDVETLDIELRRTGKSYTADTLEELHARFPADELWLLVGADMFLTIQNWYEPERIMALAGIAAFARTETDSGELLRVQADYLTKTYQARVQLVELPKITDLSSTQMRELLEEGQGGDRLWPPVYGYILRNGLYGERRDLKRLIFASCDAQERENFLQTIRLYFDQDGDIRRCADQIYVHRNTSQYRMDQLRKKTGYAVRVPKDSMLLYLAAQEDL